MKRRPIEARIETGRRDEEDEGPGVEGESFRGAMARWASGVSVVAVRDADDGRVYATTVSALASISARPPRIAISLGPGAQALPFLSEGGHFVVNILARDQSALASRYADAFPVGPDPFPAEGDPAIQGTHARLTCEVERLVPVGSSRLVVGLVVETDVGGGTSPLLYHERGYAELSDDT